MPTWGSTAMPLLQLRDSTPRRNSSRSSPRRPLVSPEYRAPPCIAGFYKQDRQLSRLVRISTGVSIFASCIGLLGLILFIVERKKKEISIRKLLGSGVGGIIYLLNKEFMVLVAIALVIATPISFLGMHRWLQSFAYRINISWWTFVLAGMITLAISMLTTSLGVIRAALINPADNLRSE